MAGDEQFDPEEHWDAETMLDGYIHDYLVKRNFHQAAEIFAHETDVDSRHRVGFSREWWSNEVYRARAQTNNRGVVDSTPHGAINPRPVHLNAGRMTVGALLFVVFSLIFGFAYGEDLPIRINCGALEAEYPLTADHGFSGGLIYETTPVFVSPFPIRTGRLFSKSVYGAHNCYTFYAPDGHYSLRIFFGRRDGIVHFFPISLKGTTVLNPPKDWDLYIQESFLEIAHSFQDGEVSICFHHISTSPCILSIEVFKLPHIFPLASGMYLDSFIYRTHRRLDFGSNMSRFDRNVELGDRFWEGITFLAENGMSVLSSKSIEVTSQYPAFIYESGIRATDYRPDLRFVIERIVPQKRYLVSLHFCQIFRSLRENVFDIVLEEETVYAKFDIVEVTGGINRPFVVNHEMEVATNSLMVYLRATKGSVAFINAMEIKEVIEPNCNTLSSEVVALRKLKSMLRLPSQKGWNGDPCCPEQYQWLGVTCSLYKKRNVQNIIGLTLVKQSLRGKLPEEFSEFSCLEFLNLSNNEFQGSIPRSYVRLRRLKLLNLSGNLLSGQIPEFPKSVSLSLEGNVGLCGYNGFPSCDGEFIPVIVSCVGGGLLLLVSAALLAFKLRSKIAKHH